MVYAKFFRKPFSQNARLTPSPLLLYLSHNTPPSTLFSGAFSECNQTREKKSFFLKSFTSENILHWKIFYSETNRALDTINELMGHYFLIY
jgi:hypothetical protein